MKVLVVGGAGYIGGALTDILMKTDNEIKVYDQLLYEDSYRKPVSFIYGDVRDREKLLPHLKWADAVIWLAALVGDQACALNPDITKEINTDSVKWLSENFNGRIVFMSTCSVYGAQNEELDEQSPVNPLSVYASSKFDAEKFLENKNALVFRLGTLFGAGDIFSRIRFDLVVNVLTVKAHDCGLIKVFGGEQFRPLLHVKDAARAAADGILSKKTGIYNLKKENIRIVDLAKRVKKYFPDLKVETTEMHFQDARNYKVSSEKAEAELNFSPAYSIDDGIEEIKQLMNDDRIKDINSVRYSNHGYLEKHKTHLACPVK